MRIAQVAPLYESVPPKYYGGTDRVVSCLIEERVRQGHQVTLFASVDYMYFPLTRREPIKHVITLHGRLDIPDLVPLYQEFRDKPVISISNEQRKPLPWPNWQFSIDWPEPFGLVMIEAMACGTSVIAYRGSAVSEIMEKAHAGFVVDALEDAVEAVHRVQQLNRKRCREVFEKRFTAARMASDYVRVFEQLIGRNQEKMSEAA